MATFASVHTIPVTTELTATALQRGEPDAYEDSLLMAIGASAIPSSQICSAFRRSSGDLKRPCPFPAGLNLS